MRSRVLLAYALVVLLGSGCLEDPGGNAAGTGSPAGASEQPSADIGPLSVGGPTTSPRPESQATALNPSTGTTTGALLYAAKGGDGDSWKDREGREYRLGLVNTPELGECYGQAASDHRKQLTRAGFRAQTYTTDKYGRRVSIVTLADGRNLNVLLARTGYANDTYLARYRAENPGLARQLYSAFAGANQEHVGLWGRCRTSAASGGKSTTASPARGNCAAAYPDVCIPPAPPDLDCGDISYRRFRVLAPDPHRFDADGDGIGCESG
jgi:micrococcal nuclease